MSINYAVFATTVLCGPPFSTGRWNVAVHYIGCSLEYIKCICVHVLGVNKTSLHVKSGASD